MQTSPSRRVRDGQHDQDRTEEGLEDQFIHGAIARADIAPAARAVSSLADDLATLHLRPNSLALRLACAKRRILDTPENLAHECLSMTWRRSDRPAGHRTRSSSPRRITGVQHPPVFPGPDATRMPTAR